MSLRHGYLRAFLVAAFGLFVSSCVPPGGDPGTCALEGDEEVNTYSVFGKWKKIQGYPAPRSKTELNLNYDILIVEPGSRLCVAEIKNGANAQTSFRANYEHNVSLRKLQIVYDEGLGAGTAEGAQYSFSGSCNDTKMTLRYDDGSYEVYELYNIVAQPGDCDPDSSSGLSSDY